MSLALRAGQADVCPRNARLLLVAPKRKFRSEPEPVCLLCGDPSEGTEHPECLEGNEPMIKTNLVRAVSLAFAMEVLA
jgi:hypothetical protein